VDRDEIVNHAMPNEEVAQEGDEQEHVDLSTDHHGGA
jgi:hypothetical protein